MDSYLESGAIADARVSFPKTPNQYGDWMEGMFWLTSAFVLGPTGKRVSWASTLKSLENNNLLTQQFHDHHTINAVQRFVADFLQAKYRQSTLAEG